MRTDHSGFTLLEILIALFIFTIVALIMTKSLHSILTTQEVTENSAEQLAATQTALLLLSRDLEQALDRPVSDSEGRVQGAFLGDRTELTLTHGGLANPDGDLPASALQRTRYRLEKDQLIRDTWAELDQAPHILPHSRVLLSGVREFYFRYLDSKNVFHSFWPPDGDDRIVPSAGQSTDSSIARALEILKGGNASQLPRAVEMNIRFEQGGGLQQIYLLPQQEVPYEPH